MDQRLSNRDQATRPARLRPSLDVVGQRMGEAAILIHLQTNQIYELNRTGARFWDLLVAGLDREAIVQQLLQEYGVDTAQVVAEVDALLSALLAAGLIHVEH